MVLDCPELRYRENILSLQSDALRLPANLSISVHRYVRSDDSILRSILLHLHSIEKVLKRNLN